MKKGKFVKGIKNFFKGWNAFEYTMFGLGLTLPLVLGIIFASDPILIVCGMFSTVSSLLLAKGKIEGYFLCLVSSALYAISSWRLGLYGEVVIQGAIMYPLLIGGIVSWAKNRRKDRVSGRVVVIGTVKWRELIILFASQLVMSVGYYYLLKLFNTEYLIISTVSLTCAVFYGYLMIRRSRLGMVMSVLSDLPTLTIWILMMTQGMYYVVPFLVMESMYVIQDIYGIFEWRSLKNRQKRGRRKKKKTTETNIPEVTEVQGGIAKSENP